MVCIILQGEDMAERIKSVTILRHAGGKNYDLIETLSRHPGIKSIKAFLISNGYGYGKYRVVSSVENAGKVKPRNEYIIIDRLDFPEIDNMDKSVNPNINISMPAMKTAGAGDAVYQMMFQFLQTVTTNIERIHSELSIIRDQLDELIQDSYDDDEEEPDDEEELSGGLEDVLKSSVADVFKNAAANIISKGDENK